MQRLDPSEYHEYYRGYVDNVPQGDVLLLLQTEVARTLTLLEQLPPEKKDHTYALGKWGIRDVVGHPIDSERMFGYRALCFAPHGSLMPPNRTSCAAAPSSA